MSKALKFTQDHKFENHVSNWYYQKQKHETDGEEKKNSFFFLRARLCVCVCVCMSIQQVSLNREKNVELTRRYQRQNDDYFNKTVKTWPKTITHFNEFHYTRHFYFFFFCLSVCSSVSFST